MPEISSEVQMFSISTLKRAVSWPPSKLAAALIPTDVTLFGHQFKNQTKNSTSQEEIHFV